MSLEKYLALINENFFFKEFSFSENQFSPVQKSNLEFADHVIWLDDLFITFQLKERNSSGSHTRETEINWFENKVLKVATKQIRDTLQYLNTYKEINITNERGHIFNIVSGNLRKIINVVLYSSHELLSEEYKRKKFYLSTTAGFIHLIPISDYVGICQTLITPVEVGEYLEFRKEIGMKYENQVNTLPEQVLVGQFLSGDLDHEPCIEFVEYLATLNQKHSEFDLSYIINSFEESIVTANKPYDYYQILKELAKLNRNELEAFKSRFILCVERCKEKEISFPYRVAFPRTGCGFVFVNIPLELIHTTLTALQNFTLAHKYDQKLGKCIGISFSRDGEYLSINWCYIKKEWKYDSEMEQLLKENFPFRSVKEKYITRYTFDE